MKGKHLVIKQVFQCVMFHAVFFFIYACNKFYRRVFENEKENRKYTALYGNGSISVRRMWIDRSKERIVIILGSFLIRVIGS